MVGFITGGVAHNKCRVLVLFLACCLWCCLQREKEGRNAEVGKEEGATLVDTRAFEIGIFRSFEVFLGRVGKGKEKGFAVLFVCT